MTDFVAVEDRGAVRWLTLTNSGRMNAVPPTGWADLAQAFTEFEQFIYQGARHSRC